MTAVRAYNKPKSVAAARREMVRCAGSHFDPTVVRAL
jgi:HD-GYP domain-containing protein (c-di-GMP phosphodiesterase class II)